MEVITNVLNQDWLAALEEQIVNFVLNENHIYLFFTLIGVMGLLRYVPFLQKHLFTETRKWLAAPINVGLSAIGVFLLNMTPATTLGLKIFVVVAESTLATFLYEAAIKRLVGFVQNYINKKRNIDSASMKDGGAQ